MSLLAAAAEVPPGSRPSRARRPPGCAISPRSWPRLSQLAEAAPDEVIRQVLDRSGYRLMLQGSSDPEDQERLANIEELITAARQFAAEDSEPHHRRLPGKHHPGQRRGRLGRAPGLRLGHDAARRQGAGVPRGLHGGGRAGPAAARAQPAQERGSGRGTPPGLRGHDPGQGGVVPVPCPPARVPRPGRTTPCPACFSTSCRATRSRRIDLSASGARHVRRAIDEWRGGGGRPSRAGRTRA